LSLWRLPALTLTFAQPFIDVPRETAIELFALMDRVLHALNGIPRGSPIWESLVTSWLVLHVGDWRFHYKIDPDANKVVVMAAARRESSSAA
jgi:hypothetical protein